MDLDHGPTSSIEALAILDFLSGDEWAGITEEYAEMYGPDAVRIVEDMGMAGPYRHVIHNILWKEN